MSDWEFFDWFIFSCLWASVILGWVSMYYQRKTIKSLQRLNVTKNNIILKLMTVAKMPIPHAMLALILREKQEAEKK